MQKERRLVRFGRAWLAASFWERLPVRLEQRKAETTIGLLEGTVPIMPGSLDVKVILAESSHPPKLG